MFLSFPSQGKLFLILFPNRVEKESLSQSNEHVSYTRGHANQFDTEIAFGTTNWLSLQWSTVISLLSIENGSSLPYKVSKWCAIFPRTPRTWEIIRRPTANWVHRSLTSAGFSASSVEKYHYPLHLSSPSPVAIRLISV